MSREKTILLILASTAIVAAIVLASRPAKGKGISLTYTA